MAFFSRIIVSTPQRQHLACIVNTLPALNFLRRFVAGRRHISVIAVFILRMSRLGLVLSSRRLALSSNPYSLVKKCAQWVAVS